MTYELIRRTMGEEICYTMVSQYHVDCVCDALFLSHSCIVRVNISTEYKLLFVFWLDNPIVLVTASTGRSITPRVCFDLVVLLKKRVWLCTCVRV